VTPKPRALTKNCQGAYWGNPRNGEVLKKERKNKPRGWAPGNGKIKASYWLLLKKKAGVGKKRRFSRGRKNEGKPTRGGSVKQRERGEAGRKPVVEKKKQKKETHDPRA